MKTPSSGLGSSDRVVGGSPTVARDRRPVDVDQFRATGARQRKKLLELAGRLRRGPFFGNRIRRSQIPQAFRSLPNVFRLELLDGWRALYTVASRAPFGSQLRIISIGDHKR